MIGPNKNSFKSIPVNLFFKQFRLFLDQVGAVFLGHLISFSGRAEIEAKYRTCMCHYPPPPKKKKKAKEKKKYMSLVLFNDFFFFTIFFSCSCFV